MIRTVKWNIFLPRPFNLFAPVNKVTHVLIITYFFPKVLKL